MKRLFALLLCVAGLAGVLIAVSVAGSTEDTSADTPSPAAAASPAQALEIAPTSGFAAGGSLADQVQTLADRVERVPGDYAASATLAIAYVQQAAMTHDAALYEHAEEAVEISLAANDTNNDLAYAGLAAIAAGRHHFAEAEEHALRGLEINPYSTLLLGVLSDAQIQQGRYDEGFASVQRMVDLSPDTSSLARASYTWELRGDHDQARILMERAAADAPSPDDRVFATLILGELAMNIGDPNTALRHYLDVLEIQPNNDPASFGKARAEAAIGQVQTAIDDFEYLVNWIPDADHFLAYAEHLESVGHQTEADARYADMMVALELVLDRNLTPEPLEILIDADHGDPQRALTRAEAGIQASQFVEMWDAYAWALHVNGRDAEALEASDRALELGTRNAGFHYHAGMIRFALGDLDGARQHLTTALEINPYFSATDAVTASETLAGIG